MLKLLKDISVRLLNVQTNNLVKTTSTPLSKGRYYMGSATIGNYALFAGGSDQFNQYAYVDAYTI